ncbi:MAG: hypothetical protein EZS28_039971, partial [Streblomastix strix]
GQIIIDNLYKHGLINIEQLNKDLITSGVKDQIIIDGIFAGGCHSAVGSALTVIGLQMELTDSTFVQPLCFGNMIYLNQTKNYIQGCQFVGYNGSFVDSDQDDEEDDQDDDEQQPSSEQPQTEEGQEQEVKDENLCPENRDYFSSSIHALVFIKNSESQIQETSFENTGIGAIKVEDSNIIIEDVQFTESNSSEDGSVQFEGNEMMVSCVGDSTFIGCTAIVPNNYEQQISVCYTIGQNSQVYIDERDLLHTSWQRQNNEGVVRFIGKSDSEHLWNPDTICGQITNPCDTYGAVGSQIQKEQETSDGSQGRVETLIYCEGKFISTYMDMILTRSKTVNFLGFGREKTELGAKINFYNTMLQGIINQNIVMEKLRLSMQPASPKVGIINIPGKNGSLVLLEVNVQGYIDTNPQNTMMEPEYFIQCEGFVILIDVIMEHIYMRTGTVMLIQNMRSFSGDSGQEMVSKIKSGFYECIFDDITTNETSLFMITDMSLSNNGEIQLNEQIESNMQSNANQLKLKIQGSLFSNCFSSLKLNKRRINGGLINIISKGTRIEIGGCDFSDNLMHSRNMVYIGIGC